MDIFAYILKFTSLTSIFYFIFQKCMQQLNLSVQCSWKAKNDTRNFIFACYILMCKIRHLFSAKRSFENLHVMIGRNVIIISLFSLFSLKYSKMSIKQITQKSDLSVKRSTSLYHCSVRCTLTSKYSFWL